MAEEPGDPVGDRVFEVERLRRLFRFFAATQCRGRSPVYEALSEGVARDDELLDLLMSTLGEHRRPSLLFAAVNLLLGLAYYAYLEGSPSGQTVGKRAMSIRVIDFAGGGPIGPGRALIRYLGRIVSAIPCGLGFFWMLWDPEKQTWHDKVVSSVVVKA